ncbi:MAG: type II secretion system F family protein [Devosia sp.]
MSAAGNLPVFHFKGARADGSLATGQLSAIDQQHALLLLQRDGVRPIRLQARPLPESWLHRDIGWLGAKTLSVRDGAQFCSELHVLLDAGLELPDALMAMLASERKNTKAFRFGTAVLSGIKLGKGFSASIESAGFRLPADMVPVLRAGEEAGALATAVGALGEALGQRGKLGGEIASALAYPIFLLIVVSIVLGILAGFVAPALGRLFVSMDRAPPTAIALLWQTSEFVTQNAVPLAAAAAGAILLLVILLRSEPGRRIAGALARHIPVLGGLLVWSSTARFASALSLSVATNVATANALERSLVSAGTIAPAAITRSVNLVRRGSTLEQALTSLRFLPPKALHLIAIGEKSGRLKDVLQIVVEEARMQTERRAALIGALLGPTLILVVGAMVGLTVFSIFSALMEVNSFAS